MLGPAEKAEIIDKIYTEYGLPGACKAVGKSLRIVMDEADTDPEFGKEVQQALSRLAPIGEQEMFRRAVVGIKSVVTNNGKVVYVSNPEFPGTTHPLIERKYSDSLLSQWMKARDRSNFGDKVEVNHHHSGHIAVPVISQADLMRALETGQSLEFTPQNVIDGEYALITDQSVYQEEPGQDHDELAVPEDDDDADFAFLDASEEFGI